MTLLTLAAFFIPRCSAITDWDTGVFFPQQTCKQHLSLFGELSSAATPAKPTRTLALVCHSQDWFSRLQTTKYQQLIPDPFDNNRLLSRERFHLNPDSESLKILRRFSPTTYQATAYLTSPHLTPASPLPRQLAQLETKNCRIAASFIDQNAALIRILATDSISLRKTILELRNAIYSNLKRHSPEWRKL